MDEIYYGLGFIVFWLWCGLVAYYGFRSLVAEYREQREKIG